MGIKEIIDSFAAEKNIIAGVCGAEPLDTRPGRAAQADAPFINYTPEQRKAPGSLLKGAESIVVIGAGYNRELRFEPDGKPRGYFSLGAVGVDYHITLRAILKDLDALLRRKGFVFDSHISVDTGPLPEKLLAVKAGLGFIGKNGLCISDAFGSFFNIGYMITTLRIEPWHSTNTESCGECDRCVMACPGGALDGVYDFTRCISYLTQKKEEPGVSERRLMGLCLYGCDICQKACPYNANTYVGKIESQDYIAPELSELLALTKKDFDFKYKSTAIYWRGLENLKRNAAIALENYNVEGES